MVALMITDIFSHKWKIESNLYSLDFGIKNIHQNDNPGILTVNSYTHAGIVYIPEAEKRGQIGDWILYRKGKHGVPQLSFYWLELCQMVIPSCKGVWERAFCGMCDVNSSICVNASSVKSSLPSIELHGLLWLSIGICGSINSNWLILNRITNPFLQ